MASYQHIGWLKDSSILCDAHMEEYLKDEYGLCDDEIHFVMHGYDDDYNETMIKWPVRVMVGRYLEKYVYDADGHMLFNEDVSIPDDDPIWEIKNNADYIPLNDDGEWEDGAYCDVDNEELVEPITQECWTDETHTDNFGEAVAIGSQEYTEVNERYEHSQMICRDCYLRLEKETIKNIIQEIQSKQNIQDTRAYWIYSDFIKNIQARLKKMYISDILQDMEEKLSIADVQEQTPESIIANIVRENLELEDALLVCPPFEVVNGVRGHGFERDTVHLPPTTKEKASKNQKSVSA